MTDSSISAVVRKNQAIYSREKYWDHRRLRKFSCFDNDQTYALATQMILDYSSDKYQRIFEIGTAGGEYLNYLSHKLPNKIEMFGFDVYSYPIETNRRHYQSNPKLTWYYHQNLATFLSNNLHMIDNTLFVGMWVLENIPHPDLLRFLDILSKGKNVSLLFASTTLTENHFQNSDYVIRETGTHFEHNYLKLLKDRDFNIQIIKTPDMHKLHKVHPTYNKSKYITYYILCESS